MVLVLQAVQLHLRHHHLQLVLFCTITLSIVVHVVAKQPLQLLHAVKLLFVVEALRHHHPHLQPLIAILATATEALVELTVMELGV